MNVLIIEPRKKPYIKDIDSGLKSLQSEVGGYIEAIYPFKEKAAIVCNEEGKMNGLPLNRAIYDEDGKIVDIIAGTFMIVGLGEEDLIFFADDLADKFSRQYELPEEFHSFNGEIRVEKVKPLDNRPTPVEVRQEESKINSASDMRSVASHTKKQAHKAEQER
jgi:hypothetical protein